MRKARDPLMAAAGESGVAARVQRCRCTLADSWSRLRRRRTADRFCPSAGNGGPRNRPRRNFGSNLSVQRKCASLAKSISKNLKSSWRRFAFSGWLGILIGNCRVFWESTYERIAIIFLRKVHQTGKRSTNRPPLISGDPVLKSRKTENNKGIYGVIVMTGRIWRGRVEGTSLRWHPCGYRR
jgi:hypothetical protein